MRGGGEEGGVNFVRESAVVKVNLCDVQGPDANKVSVILVSSTLFPSVSDR